MSETNMKKQECWTHQKNKKWYLNGMFETNTPGPSSEQSIGSRPNSMPPNSMLSAVPTPNRRLGVGHRQACQTLIYFGVGKEKSIWITWKLHMPRGFRQMIGNFTVSSCMDGSRSWRVEPKERIKMVLTPKTSHIHVHAHKIKERQNTCKMQYNTI